MYLLNYRNCNACATINSQSNVLINVIQQSIKLKVYITDGREWVSKSMPLFPATEIQDPTAIVVSVT